MDALIAALPDIFAASVRMCVPLLLVALGELYSERAGLVNIGLDGLMTIGAFIGFGGSMFRSACKPHLCLLYRYALRKSGSCGHGHQYSHARYCDVCI